MMADQQLNGLRGVLHDALDRAAGEAIYSSGRVEHQLVLAVERQLERVCPGAMVREASYDAEPGEWSRSPGGFDLAATLPQGQQIAAEMKLDDADQCLWDVFKLASRCPGRFAEAAVVFETAERRLRADRELMPLFLADHEWEASSRRLIERWPKAWLDLILGGRGIRPRRVPAVVRLSSPTGFGLRRYPGHRVCVVWCCRVGEDILKLDELGWPVGYEPPTGYRETIRADDQRRQAMITAARPDAVLCAGYSVPKPLPRGRIAEWMGVHVPRMTPEQRHALRQELEARGWDDGDLERYVDPYAH